MIDLTEEDDRLPANLRDRIAATIWERQNPGRRYADCEYLWQADAEADADAVLPLVAQELQADWSRYRGAVLQEAWEALRDAEGGPLLDAMNVINGLLEK